MWNSINPKMWVSRRKENPSMLNLASLTWAKVLIEVVVGKNQRLKKCFWKALKKKKEREGEKKSSNELLVEIKIGDNLSKTLQN